MHTLTADNLAADSATAGEHLWRAIELASDHIPGPRLVIAFEAALEQITEEVEGDEARELYRASAMIAVRAMVGETRRNRIDRDASDAWQAYVRFLRDVEGGDVADWRRDAAREVA